MRFMQNEEKQRAVVRLFHKTQYGSIIDRVDGMKNKKDKRFLSENGQRKEAMELNRYLKTNCSIIPRPLGP